MTDSLAIFRNRLGPDLSKLAEKHMQHEYEFLTLAKSNYIY